MKLIITGASGFVGDELVRQSLKHPEVTSVIALARKPLTPPTDLGDGVDISKFHSVKVDDYGVYSDEVKKQLAHADACIWTVAVTPSKSKEYSDEDLRKINHDHTLIGLKAIFEASQGRQSSKPFRFLYMSGVAAERDQTKTPKFMPKYTLMRGETESAVLKYAADQNGRLEACVAKPGLIALPGDILKYLYGAFLKFTLGLPSIYRTEISAAMIAQVINGFEKEPLMNEDLVRIGQKALST